MQVATRQWPATPRTLLLGCLHACWPVLAAGLLTFWLLYAAGLGPNLLFAYGIGLITWVVSMWVHEYAHLWLLRRELLAVRVVQQGMRVGLLHQAGSRHIECLSALAGPASGIGFCTALAWGSWMLNASAATIAIGTVGLLHLGSLWPTYGDGHSLFRARTDIPW